MRVAEDRRMKAWLCHEPVGVDALEWTELPTPEPRPGEVRVVVRAASLNFPDLLVVEGKYQIRPQPPFVPGAEFAGVVDAVGLGVRHPKPGDAVAAIGTTGGFATHACLAATQAIALPDGFDIEDGAAFVFTYGTAYHALVDRAALRAGEAVVLLGAAGGVGTAALQIAKAVGARVLATASTDAKCNRCRELGADEALNYTSQDVRDRLRAFTHGRGPDVVLDPVGGSIAEKVFRSIAWRGRYLVIGFADGVIPALPWNLPLLKGASLVGVYFGEFVRREPQAFGSAFTQLARWYAQGLVKPVIDARLPMTALREAYARMGSRRVVGKLLLVNP
jgi:NADPH2:quinone reductase